MFLPTPDLLLASELLLFALTSIFLAAAHLPILDQNHLLEGRQLLHRRRRQQPRAPPGRRYSKRLIPRGHVPRVGGKLGSATQHCFFRPLLTVLPAVTYLLPLPLPPAAYPVSCSSLVRTLMWRLRTVMTRTFSRPSGASRPLPARDTGEGV